MREFKGQSGISQIELLIVLAITAVMVGMAVARFDSAKDNFKRQNIARELKVNLERARFDSVKRRPNDGTAFDNEKSRVVINSATSFSVFVDYNQDGLVTDAERRNVDFSYVEGVRILGRNSNNENLVFPVTVKFDRRGHVTIDGTGASIPTPSFVVCDAGCTYETATNENSNKISVSTTGTVTMTGGGETNTTFSNPSVSNVDPCKLVNDFVTVIDSSRLPPKCGTPTPSPSASASPSGTPEQRSCNINERPSSNNCVCRLPLTVHNNGRCY